MALDREEAMLNLKVNCGYLVDKGWNYGKRNVRLGLEFVAGNDFDEP
jgi:hypothetical protein